MDASPDVVNADCHPLPLVASTCCTC